MTKLQEAKLALNKAGYRLVREGSYDPSKFEYDQVPFGDNKPNTAKPTGVRYAKTGDIHEGQGAATKVAEAKKLLLKAGYKIDKKSHVREFDAEKYKNWKDPEVAEAYRKQCLLDDDIYREHHFDDEWTPPQVSQYDRRYDDEDDFIDEDGYDYEAIYEAKNKTPRTRIKEDLTKSDVFVRKMLRIIKDDVEEWGNPTTWEELGGRDYVIKQIRLFGRDAKNMFNHDTPSALLYGEEEDELGLEEQWSWLKEELLQEFGGKYDDYDGIDEATSELLGFDINARLEAASEKVYESKKADRKVNLKEDVYVDPKAGAPGEELPSVVKNNGNEEINEQDYPAESTEKGVVKESKTKESISYDYDDLSYIDDLVADPANFEEDFLRDDLL